MGARWNGLVWIEQRRCRECGTMIDAADPDCCMEEFA
jgi:hypothetical protein